MIGERHLEVFRGVGGRRVGVSRSRTVVRRDFAEWNAIGGASLTNDRGTLNRR